MTKIIKSFIFLLILFTLGGGVINVLWIKNSTSMFFKEPQNTMDIVYIGASNVYIHFNSTLAFKEYGFTTGILSAGAQTPAAIEYLLKESEKYQNPSLYIIDLTKFAENLNIYTEGELRNTFDAMPFSWNRIIAINNCLKYYDLTINEYINYYFSLFKYHNSWKSVSIQNFIELETLYKGFELNSENIVIKKQNIEKWNNDTMLIQDDSLHVLNSLLDYLDRKKLNCLFVIPKRGFSTENMKKMNYIIEVIKKRNYQVINLNKIDGLKIDSNNDFYNFFHLNIYGATKYTLYFSKYLHEHYNLPDHREDKKYKSWNEAYDKLKEQYNTLLKKDFEDLIKEDKILLNISN